MVLGLSRRQVRRLRRRVEAKGRAALQHGNRGRPPANKLGEAVRERIVALRRTKYRDFNDQHFTEKLVHEQPVLQVSVATVRRVDGRFTEISLAAIGDDGAPGEPYFARRFDHDQTKEVRLILHNGADRVRVLKKPHFQGYESCPAASVCPHLSCTAPQGRYYISMAAGRPGGRGVARI